MKWCSSLCCIIFTLPTNYGWVMLLVMLYHIYSTNQLWLSIQTIYGRAYIYTFTTVPIYFNTKILMGWSTCFVIHVNTWEGDVSLWATIIINNLSHFLAPSFPKTQMHNLYQLIHLHKASIHEHPQNSRKTMCKHVTSLPSRLHMLIHVCTCFIKVAHWLSVKTIHKLETTTN